MAGGQCWMNTVLGEYAQGGYADGENGRLGVFGELEVLFRAFEDDFGEGKAEGFIGLGEGLGGDGETIGEIAAHAYRLRTLAGKKKGELGGHFSKDFILTDREHGADRCFAMR